MLLFNKNVTYFLLRRRRQQQGKVDKQLQGYVYGI